VRTSFNKEAGRLVVDQGRGNSIDRTQIQMQTPGGDVIKNRAAS
jgi:hypothetical protein